MSETKFKVPDDVIYALPWKWFLRVSINGMATIRNEFVHSTLIDH